MVYHVPHQYVFAINVGESVAAVAAWVAKPGVDNKKAVRLEPSAF
ncbi:MAG: hypothetical protein JWO50_184 [Candidatus Kaiserbacteria bacterium]|nr:hypothetical protein [Candidatus Kaiserbacteria bacterium]